MPKERIEKIFSTLNPVAIVTDKEHQAAAAELNDNVYLIEDIKLTEIDRTALNTIRETQIDTDPVYILYTPSSETRLRFTFQCP